MSKRKLWSLEDKEKLKLLYPNTNNKELIIIFNCSIGSLYNTANSLKINKAKDFLLKQNQELVKKLSEFGKVHRYKKGSIPANKGKKQSKYMTPEQIEKTMKTRFKKGNNPTNFKPVGSKRINVDGYIEIKIKDPNKWELKHRVVWKKQNGKIPKGYNIQFKDGNRQNCSIDNLYIISRAEQMKNENSFHARYPEAIKKVIRAKASLTKEINKHQATQLPSHQATQSPSHQ